MTREKPVGTGEREVLQKLANLGGEWQDGDGILYESKYWTLQLLSSLTAKGLVEEVVPDAHYRLTRQGLAHDLSESWYPQVPSQGRNRGIQAYRALG